MRKHIFSLAIIAMNLIMWAIAYPHISGQVPIHWSSSGEIDRYASKMEAMLAMIGLLVFV